MLVNKQMPYMTAPATHPADARVIEEKEEVKLERMAASYASSGAGE
jgi:hypothetical protein